MQTKVVSFDFVFVRTRNHAKAIKNGRQSLIFFQSISFNLFVKTNKPTSKTNESYAGILLSYC